VPEDQRPSPAVHVREAAERFGIAVPARPAAPTQLLASARQQLIEDHVDELQRVTDPWDYPTGTAPVVDVANVAHSLADVVLIAYGTAAAYGIDLDPVIAEVHRSHLTQRRATAAGNVRQGGAFIPPNVPAVLAGQRDGSDSTDHGWWADQVVQALVPAGDEFDPEMPGDWLDAPHDQLPAGDAPWEAITQGRGAVVWQLLASLCDASGPRGAQP